MTQLKIILDTNFLMLLHQYGIDIFSEIGRLVPEDYELLIPRKVSNELDSIGKKSRGVDGISARVALQLIQKKNILTIEDDRRVDDSIVDFVNTNVNCIVCTNDKNLKRKIKNKAQLIYMRGKDHLVRI